MFRLKNRINLLGQEPFLEKNLKDNLHSYIDPISSIGNGFECTSPI
jgi:hypothetical protein